ncbi:MULTISPECIES: hypothetical protein [Brucella/Ochrobactrum group]|uniref:hypothetical protein n=1 Tax=Brucella/Ochrobactrum group TaxID=2826938 RepID=UPI000D68E851|nr:MULTISPECIES: hypothetical protein [Brucella]MCI1001199.1 hypothetical protein [Ochrobactrum sp. C6C9]MDX4073378.1 hypothetical protein [Brucella sp. NBRC 113783]RLL74032.1 hypothetical protein D8666_12445 [[Ochrobactrum] soli]RRD24561.1 hypothetical protein ECB98_12560 [Brucellaceae bacterium VT-16-1752]
MSQHVKIYNSEHRAYLVCRRSTWDGIHPVELNKNPSIEDFYQTWTLAWQDQHVFILEIAPIQVNLFMFDPQSPINPIPTAHTAWAAKTSYKSPVELIYNAKENSIKTNAGSSSLYLTSDLKESFAYFDIEPQKYWEIQYDWNKTI